MAANHLCQYMKNHISPSKVSSYFAVFQKNLILQNEAAALELAWKSKLDDQVLNKEKSHEK